MQIYTQYKNNIRNRINKQNQKYFTLLAGPLVVPKYLEIMSSPLPRQPISHKALVLSADFFGENECISNGNGKGCKEKKAVINFETVSYIILAGIGISWCIQKYKNVII
jgi:hypothetical protein